MRALGGELVAGRIGIEGEPLEENCTFTNLAPAEGEIFVLDAEAEVSLLAALAEADRGETVGGNEFLNKLRKRL